MGIHPYGSRQSLLPPVHHAVNFLAQFRVSQLRDRAVCNWNNAGGKHWWLSQTASRCHPASKTSPGRNAGFGPFPGHQWIVITVRVVLLFYFLKPFCVHHCCGSPPGPAHIWCHSCMPFSSASKSSMVPNSFRDALVIADIIPVIGIGRTIDGVPATQYPPEAFNIIQLWNDPFQIADTIAITVFKLRGYTWYTTASFHHCFAVLSVTAAVFWGLIVTWYHNCSLRLKSPGEKNFCT